MFESAELGHEIDKATYKAEVPAIREKLLDAQYELLDKHRFPLIIVIAGVDGAGKGETVNELNSWMDARHITTYAADAPTAEEDERPPMFRYWRALPPKGKTGVFFGSWYSHVVDTSRRRGEVKDSEIDVTTEDIKRFERMLANEGALILKFWFHLSKSEQKKRFRSLEKRAATRWRVTQSEWESLANYDRNRAVAERVLRRTSTAEAPWLVVEGADARYRQLTVAKSILGALERRFAAPPSAPVSHEVSPSVQVLDDKNVLRQLDLTKTLSKEDYAVELEREERRLGLLTRSRRFHKISVVAAFEGSDAAGKGGAIRRVTSALDARLYRVTPIAAPTEEERAQPYLWRFWRHLPRRGKIQFFDRSWYGRVLVERVEGFCGGADWNRAYSEINDFEEQLADSGVVLLKYWLQIGKDEQLARFEARKQTGFKRFKITDEDWRNRDKWDLYEAAVCDMVDRTSTEVAPWTLVPANDKRYARIAILRELNDRIEKAL